MTSKTPWQGTRLPRFPKLRENLRCDVLVIGGGITGLTAAYLLAKVGKKVCLLERGRLAGGDTGCTTAHLAMVTDLRLSELASSFGNEGARLAWEGGAAAINTIEEIARRENIDCEFRRIPGFLHASLKSDRDETRDLQRDCQLANKLGFGASFVPLVPQVGKPGIRFPNQAKFHPLKYLSGLAKATAGAGGHIFEDSEAVEFLENSRAVTANGKRVECDLIVIATHVPLVGEASLTSATMLQTKLAPYSTYAIGAKIPKGFSPEASFWDTSDPYYYLRIDEGDRADYAIFGGEDHRTGQAANLEDRIARLEERLQQLIPHAKVECHWSSQVVETHDGLPYIGEMTDGQFEATGFAGNGLTFGTLGGMMACDAALGRHNPWQDLFHVNRKKISGVWGLVKLGLDYPYYFLRDRFATDGHSTREVKRGSGKVLKLNGELVACSRDDDGEVSGVSAVCTHMGCIVHWNEVERTWDCPCHGSRFQTTGEVVAGPAETALNKVEAPSVKTERDVKNRAPQRKRIRRTSVKPRR